jgi:hypothetical protein
LKRSLAAVAIVALGIGCASTETRSATYKSPLSHGREFWKVAVWMRAGLAERQQTEAAVVAALRDKRIDAVASLNVWPIDAAEDEVQAKLKARGIDAVLVLALEGASSTVSSVGTVSTTSLWGNTSVTNTATTVRVRGRAVYAATLYNEATARVVWKSQAFSSGNEFAGWDDICRSFVQKTASAVFAAPVMFLCVLPSPPLPDSSEHYKQFYASRVAAQAPGDWPPQEAAK